MIITEERRQQLIAYAKSMIDFGSHDATGTNEPLWEVMQIALAAMEAKQVHQFIDNKPDDDGYAQWSDCNPDFYKTVSADERRVLYDAPPAPVVPDEILTHADAKKLLRHLFNDTPAAPKDITMEVWNACRAAMLKGDAR